MKLIAVDTETELFPPLGTDKVNTLFPCPPLVCTTFAAEYEGEQENGLISWEEEEGVQGLFRIPGSTYVFHNVQFDLSVLSAAYPSLKARLLELVSAGRILDTRVMYLLRDPDPPTKKVSLAMLHNFFKHRGEPSMEKGAVRTSFRRGMRLTEEQRTYAIEDAVVTLRVAKRLLEMQYGSILSHDHQNWNFVPPPQHQVASRVVPGESPDVRFSKAACYTAWNLVPHGLGVDKVRLVEHNDILFARVVELRTQLVDKDLAAMKRARKSEIIDMAGALNQPYAPGRSWERLNVDPPTVWRTWKGRIQQTDAVITVKQRHLRVLATEWASANDIEMSRSPKTSQISLKRDDWSEFTGTGELPPEIELFMEYQRAAKHWGSFTRPLVDAGADRIYPNYWIPGAVTGRWACSKVNLQQVPKKLRDMYVPAPGNIFVSADYPTLELYTLAQAMYGMGIDGPLRAALVRHAAGEMDIHTWTAEQIGGSRQEAKEANFGLPGGMGIKRFAKTKTGRANNWTLQDAREIREKWFSVFWDIRRYLKFFNVNPYLLCPIADKREWLRRLGFDPDETWPNAFELTRKINDGRIFTVALPDGRVIPERGYSAAANCFFQGLGASVITEAFNRCCEEGIKIVSVVHDSIMAEVPKHGSPYNDQQVGTMIASNMQEALATLCPDVPVPQIDYEIHERWK